MTIKSKLLLGFIIYFLFLVLLGIFSYKHIKEISDPLSNNIPKIIASTEDTTQKIDILYNLLFYSDDSFRVLRSYIFSKDNNYLDRYLEDKKNIQLQLQRAKVLDNDLYLTQFNSINMYFKRNDEILKTLASTKNFQPAENTILNETYDQYLIDIRNNVYLNYRDIRQKINNTALQQVTGFAKFANETLQKEISTIFVIILLMGVFTLASIVLIVRAILSPLQILHKNIQTFNTNEATSLPDTIINSDDELGRLAKSYSRLMNELDSQTLHLKLLLHIAEINTQEYDFEKALSTSLNTICEELKFPIGHIYIHDEAKNVLIPTDIWCIEDEDKTREFYELTMAKPLTNGIGLCGRILTSGEATFIENVHRDKNFPRAVACIKSGIIGGFGIPVKIDNQVTAIFEFYNHTAIAKDDHFSDFINILSHQLSRIFERQHRSKLAMEDDIKKRAALIIHNLHEGYIAVDSERHIEEWNKQAEKIFGWKKEEVLGKPVEEVIIFAGDRMNFIEGILNYVKTGESSLINNKIEFHGLKQDGKKCLIELTIIPIRFNHKMSFSLFINDITLRKQMEASNDMYKTMVDTSHEAIIAKDLDGRITSWNKGAELLYGYKAEEVLDKSIKMLFPDDLKHESDDIIKKVSKGEYVKNFQTRRLTKDKRSILVSVNASPIYDKNNLIIGVTTITRDITRQVYLETELRARNIELEQKNIALEKAKVSKDKFFTSMSHELRTPLNAILGFTGTLLMRLPGDLNAEQESQLKIIQRSARHLISLINDLLDIGQIELGKITFTKETASLCVMLEEVVSILKVTALEKNLDLLLFLPPEDIYIHSDKRSVIQILINLINNAIKYTEKGSVTVKAETIHSEDGKYALINIIDTGIGIKEEDKPKIFTSFTQLSSSSAESTGLGLHVSKRIADLLNIKITFESKYGKGTKFSLYIPITIKETIES